MQWASTVNENENIELFNKAEEELELFMGKKHV